MTAADELFIHLGRVRDELNRFQVGIKALWEAAQTGDVTDEAEVSYSRLTMFRYRVRMMAHAHRLFVKECQLVHNAAVDEVERRERKEEEAIKAAPPDAPPSHPG